MTRTEALAKATKSLVFAVECATQTDYTAAEWAQIVLALRVAESPFVVEVAR